VAFLHAATFFGLPDKTSLRAVALLSPWIGYHSETFGRKPPLLVGFGVEIIRALLFAYYTEYWIVIVAQLLSGVNAAAVTVLTILVATDLTRS
jgi:predicted MFS family arabinose efflux permease